MRAIAKVKADSCLNLPSHEPLDRWFFYYIMHKTALLCFTDDKSSSLPDIRRIAVPITRFSDRWKLINRTNRLSLFTSFYPSALKFNFFTMLRVLALQFFYKVLRDVANVSHGSDEDLPDKKRKNFPGPSINCAANLKFPDAACWFLQPTLFFFSGHECLSLSASTLENW